MHGNEFLWRSPTKIKARSLTIAVSHPEVYARRLTGGVMPSRAAGMSALSSIASSSVTPSATEHDGALKFYAITGIDGPITVTTS